VSGEAQRQKFEAIVAELSARRELLSLDIDALERVQADYRGRLRAILEKELEDLDRRAVLPPVAHPELHEIDLSSPPEPPARPATRRGRVPAAVEPEAGELEIAEPEIAQPEMAPPAERPTARTVPPLGGSVFARPSGDVTDGGPPTEALVVLDEEFADTGPTGGNSRRRP
jgi:hypothetical protein